MGFFSGIGKLAGGALKGLAGPAGGLILGGLSAISGAKKQGRADKLRQQALDLQTQDYQRRAPIRDRLLRLALAQRPGRENLSATFYDPGNPYNRIAPPPDAGSPLPPTAGPSASGGGVNDRLRRALQFRGGGTRLPPELLR